MFSDDDFFFGGGPLSDDKPIKSAKQVSTGPGQGKVSRVTGRLQVTSSLEINDHVQLFPKTLARPSSQLTSLLYDEDLALRHVKFSQAYGPTSCMFV